MISLINTPLYPLTGALLSFTQIYSPGVGFLYRFNKLFLFTILIFKPESKIMIVLRGTFFWLMYKEMVKQFFYTILVTNPGWIFLTFVRSLRACF